jgi:hypothetical protein
MEDVIMCNKSRNIVEILLQIIHFIEDLGGF